ncbi:TetR family transcriptional regulator [Streptomyces viridochromogenes]|uniref:TetR family transcriptional regulator n=1 Tax=Streptomyces viridochromogenes TaxID=1938 RepID=A0A0J7ZKK9_STRVR|nr:TetR/AcrR family transcriptional regulator [Streptomyces viridochromogenes]KMS76516.1 TetR family transcriptional regulator [Streptomyces viridochromogenes]KOG23293.1 TetR family transcriptional regulator [Streptomyces viridochromogenes]KOG27102.1 TetR family transcriptional regulator [Streptomyces viridochromogenes]
MMTTRPRQGRPRHTPPSDPHTSAREQILDAAGALFVEHGIAATSTRMIAERVGVRQASLYYHFTTKDEILAELLATSVRPSLEMVERIQAWVPERASAAAALYAVAATDVRTLSRTPYNIGTLYLLPEVLAERFDAFRADRGRLQESYGALGALAAAEGVARSLPPERIGELLIQLVEVVIQIRRSREPEAADRDAIASSCLRLCGLGEPAVAAARDEAHVLLNRLT